MKPRASNESISILREVIIATILALYYCLGCVLFGVKKARYLSEDLKTISLVVVLLTIALARFANYIPQFNQGNSVTIQVGKEKSVSLDSILSVADVNDGQDLTWSTAKQPAHGQLVIQAKEHSNGGVIAPHGITYTPDNGYTGTDAFSVKVSDGLAAQSMMVHVTVLPGTGHEYMSSSGGNTSSYETQFQNKERSGLMTVTNR